MVSVFISTQLWELLFLCPFPELNAYTFLTSLCHENVRADPEFSYSQCYSNVSVFFDRYQLLLYDNNFEQLKQIICLFLGLFQLLDQVPPYWETLTLVLTSLYFPTIFAAQWRAWMPPNATPWGWTHIWPSLSLSRSHYISSVFQVEDGLAIIPVEAALLSSKNLLIQAGLLFMAVIRAKCDENSIVYDYYFFYSTYIWVSNPEMVFVFGKYLSALGKGADQLSGQSIYYSRFSSPLILSLGCSLLLNLELLLTLKPSNSPL